MNTGGPGERSLPDRVHALDGRPGNRRNREHEITHHRLIRDRVRVDGGSRHDCQAIDSGTQLGRSGDVLGAGEGWAKSILFNSRVREEFSAFFQRGDSFALGVCNGCQMMSNLRELIPGAEHWPHFVRNKSEQFEARFTMVEMLESPSLFFSGMAGSRMPIVVSHGEGFAEFSDANAVQNALTDKLVSMRFVDNTGQPTEVYPFNPNGSPQGITGLTTKDGRFSIMMPHPERVFRTVQQSWHPDGWGEDSPWLRMFRNARKFIG